MNVIVFGKSLEQIIPTLTEKGFHIVTENPDFVVTHGGDGTIIESEFYYPGIPKIVLKYSQICKRCTQGNRSFSNEEVLDAILAGTYEIIEVEKLEMQGGGKRLVAINDITVHNVDPRHGIRYTVTFDGEPYAKEIIGDGIVVATPFGSTGYYRSITDSFFEVGIGLAFNNSTEQSDHVVLAPGREISLTITRGPAEVYADNQQDSISIQTGETIVIRKAKETARLTRLMASA